MVVPRNTSSGANWSGGSGQKGNNEVQFASAVRILGWQCWLLGGYRIPKGQMKEGVSDEASQDKNPDKPERLEPYLELERYLEQLQHEQRPRRPRRMKRGQVSLYQ